MARTTLPLDLHTVNTNRLIGFSNAIRDLGTHRVCGQDVHYSYMQVRMVLLGKHTSKKMMMLIAKKRPDFFDLYFVNPAVRDAGKALI